MSDAKGNDYHSLLKQAYLEIRRLKQEVREASDRTVKRFEERESEQIAVVGMGCRFPGGSNTPEQYQDFLLQGGNGIRAVPTDRGDWSMNSKVGVRAGFLEGVDEFDPTFFGISPREAAAMDPQHRLMLLTAWEALEQAGLGRDLLSGSRTGVFVGIYNSDFAWSQLADMDSMDGYRATGMEHAFAPNRLSYLLDLKGPSIALNTACSSSLTAVHYACHSLRNGESDIALAGAVNLILSPLSMGVASHMLALAPDGACKAFDARADGIVRGEGCGTLVLKRLNDALREGDNIQAILAGSAVNEDGRTNVLTAPSGLAQAEVMRTALSRANVLPAQVTFVETHGTGTPLGDPIEFGALREVYGPGENPCILGAAKTNLGHLEAASGMAGLIKTINALKSGRIPSNLHLKELNPEISTANSRLVFPDENMEWPEAETRIAAVSAFGAGGVNAHLIIKAAPPLPDRKTPVQRQSEIRSGVPEKFFLPISAKTEQSLRGLAAAYGEFLRGDVCVHDLRRSASIGRDHYEHRLALVAADTSEFLEILDLFGRGETDPRIFRGSTRDGSRPPMAFVFSGQGTESPGMALELFESQPTFRRGFEECDSEMRSIAGWSLIEELSRFENAKSAAETSTRIMQPLLCSIQLCLTDLLISRGIKPDAAVGHSLGELAAARAAGILTRTEALRIVHRRGEVMDNAEGRMAALELTEGEAREILEEFNGRIGIAAVNGPRDVVVSGDVQSVTAMHEKYKSAEFFRRLLDSRYAFHGPAMLEPSRRLQEIITTPGSQARIPFYSTVEGSRLDGRDFDSAYLARGIRDTVRFADAVSAMETDGLRIFMEIGPRVALGGYLRETTSDAIILPTLTGKVSDSDALQNLYAALYCAGRNPDWESLRKAGSRKIAIPTYAWDNQQFPLPRADDEANADAGTKKAPLSDEPGGRRSTTLAGPAISMDGLRRAKTETRAEIVGDYIKQLLSNILRLHEDRLDMSGHIHRQGVDSLTAAEIRASLRKDLNINLPAPRLLGGLSPLDLADIILSAADLSVPAEMEPERVPVHSDFLSRLTEGENGTRAPASPLECILMRLFGDALGIDDFSRDGNFMELGGNPESLTRLHARISRELSISPSMQELTMHPRPTDAARVIYARAKDRKDNPPFIVRPFPNPDARLLLFCFPHGGGNADFYRGWKLDPRIELISLQPPGQGERYLEEPITDMETYLEMVVREFKPLLDRPWATFGHSMGTLIGFEFARRIFRETGGLPEHMIVSAGPAPDAIEETIGGLGEQALRETIRKGIPAAIIDDRELRDLFVPALLADIAKLKNYVYRSDDILKCDMTVLAGENDELVQTKHSRAWQHFTGGTFDFRNMPGGHHYAYTHGKELVQVINSILEKIIR